jgi:hypothetical protein
MSALNLLHESLKFSVMKNAVINLKISEKEYTDSVYEQESFNLKSHNSNKLFIYFTGIIFLVLTGIIISL